MKHAILLTIYFLMVACERVAVVEYVVSEEPQFNRQESVKEEINRRKERRRIQAQEKEIKAIKKEQKVLEKQSEEKSKEIEKLAHHLDVVERQNLTEKTTG